MCLFMQRKSWLSTSHNGLTDGPTTGSFDNEQQCGGTKCMRGVRMGGD